MSILLNIDAKHLTLIENGEVKIDRNLFDCLQDISHNLSCKVSVLLDEYSDHFCLGTEDEPSEIILVTYSDPDDFANLPDQVSLHLPCPALYGKFIFNLKQELETDWHITTYIVNFDALQFKQWQDQENLTKMTL